METYRNTTNGNYAMINDSNANEIIVYFGYSVSGDDNLEKRKVFKSYKTALKKAKEYVS